MDYQKFVDCFQSMTCVISVEKKPDGGYGKIRIVTGNQAYIDSIEKMEDAPKMRTNKFIPNMEYEHYLEKDLNFEDFCYRCAILKQPMHTYVHPERFDFWFNLFMLPLESDREDLEYCTYTQELSHEINSATLSNMSYESAADVLGACIKLRGTDDFDKSMFEVIHDLQSLCQAKHCCVLLMDFQTRKCRILGEAMDKVSDIALRNNWEDQSHFDLANTWYDMLGGSNCLIIKNEDDFEYVKERNYSWYCSLTESKVQSLVLFPLKYNGELLGYIWATNFDVQNTLRIKKTLELTTFFMAAEISNHMLLDRLKELSSMDMLTGVLNRNEMNNRVDLMCGQPYAGKSIGIVFVDLNGLKLVNDNEGHQAGDRILKTAAMILQNVFEEDDVFRAGGDEFMVMAGDVTPEILEQKVAAVRELETHYKNVYMAIGYCYEEDIQNIRRAMRIADERMYEDKSRFYEVHPEMRRA